MTLRILVVDDDRLVRTAMTRSLAQLRGARVRDFGSGADALEACAEEAFDVGVFDLMMPEMTGVELARQVLQKMPGIRLVFVTADVAGELADQARALGPEAVLPKPWSLKELLAIVTGASRV